MVSKIVHDLNQGTLRQFDIGIQNEVIVSQHRIKHGIVACAVAIVGYPGNVMKLKQAIRGGFTKHRLNGLGIRCRLTLVY